MITVLSNATLDLRGQMLFNTPGENAILLIEDVSNVTIIGGTFNGGGLPWYEWRMMVKILGATNVTLEGCEFRNPIGDAVYIDGQANGVIVRDCRFYGNGTNRNGVSVTSAWNVQILRNTFSGMSRPDMPGAIDLEPDSADQPVWNVAIEGNAIDGGNARGIQIYNGIAHSTQFGEIIIKGNSITGPRQVGIGVWGSPRVTEGRVVLEGNTITGAQAPINQSYWENLQIAKKRKPRKRR